jgi:hypothetical protein
MSTKKIRLVMDANGNPVQGSAHPVATDVIDVATVADVSTANFLDGVEIVEFYASEACHIKFSGSGTSATTSDQPFQAGIVKTYSLQGAKYISCIKQAGGAGTGKLYITALD